MPLGEPWPVPERATRRRVGNVLRGALAVVGTAALVVLAALVDAGDADHVGGGRERSVPERLRAIEAGTPERLGAAVFGPAPWCPRYPGWGQLALSVGTVVYDQGIERVMPVGELAAVRLRPAADVEAPLRLAPAAWVLDVTGPGGSGSIAVRALEDLAVLGAVAGWSPPPGWPTPAVGARP
jgi:hypothetical protein